jgi:hypothetical protein
MVRQKIITALAISIIILSTVATGVGIFSSGGPGAYEYPSIRGKMVTIYGKGIYRQMSAEVAPQGIAQDYVTLFIAIPVLIIGLVLAHKNSLKGRVLLTGTLGYFLITYLFYLVMGMYNALFLVYVFLLGASFFAFILSLFSIHKPTLTTAFRNTVSVKTTGGFLIFNAVCIALLWLDIIVPPLLNGAIIPAQTEHYTTLIVQGLDLAILLPTAFISGILFIKRRPWGYLLAPVYFVFLSLLMTALTAKVITMAILDYTVIPAIFIIPVFNIITLFCTVHIVRNIKEKALVPQSRQVNKLPA